MKKVLILWTGGLDSTYLIFKNLFMGNEVYMGYVDIRNNDICMKGEVQARDRLLKYIKTLQDKISFKGRLCLEVMKLCEISVNYESDFPFAQVPLFFIPITANLMSYNEIQLGFVYGDYENSDLFIQKLNNIYNGYVDLITTPITGKRKILYKSDIAKLTFPLSNTTKQEEILFIKSIDNKYKTKILNNLVHCEDLQEQEGGSIVPCGECKACRNYQKAYESLFNKEVK